MNSLPDEILGIIFQNLSLLRLFDLNLINVQSYRVAKKFLWNYHTNCFKHMLVGYQFARCTICINPFDTYRNISLKQYDAAISNLRLCDSICLVDTTINSKLLRAISHAKNIEFILCKFNMTRRKEFALLCNVESISLRSCTKIPMKYLPRLKYVRFDVDSIKNTDIPYLINVKCISICRRLEMHDIKYITNADIIERGLPYPIDDSCAMQLSRVKEIHFLASNITSGGLSYLNVTKLILDSCRNVTDDSLQHLRFVDKLEIIYCKQVTNNGMKYLSDVRSLLIDSLYITDEGMKYLTDNKCIKIKYCNLITDEGFRHLTNTESITIYQCSRITNKITTYLSYMTKVHLSVNGLTNKHLLQLSNVVNLHISDRNKYIITDRIRNLTKLERIKFSKCRRINDRMLSHISHIPHVTLKHLNHVTDNGMGHLSGLKSLRLEMMNGLTNHAYHYLKDVDRLIITGCENVVPFHY